MAEVTKDDLTAGTVSGNGMFDHLMRATKAHLEEEYKKGRIKGPEYSTVYLGALQAVMDRSLQFLLAQQKVDLEAQLLEQQLVSESKNQALLDQQLVKLVADTALVTAQISLTGQQETNLVAESLNIPKQGLLMDSDKALKDQQTVNAITEELVMQETKCKLQAEFDLIKEQTQKTTAEKLLLNQKKETELAQTQANAHESSVIGRQNALYQAQARGFQRDAEQKAAKIYVDTWNVRRTTDTTGVDDNSDNRLRDSDIGNMMDILKAGVTTP